MTIDIKDKWMWIALAAVVLLVIGVYVGWKVAVGLGGGGSIVGGIVGYSKREQKRRKEARKIIETANKQKAEIDEDAEKKTEEVVKDEKKKLAESNTQADKDNSNAPKDDKKFNDDLDGLADGFKRDRGKPLDS